jgi:hypothetical protein
VVAILWVDIVKNTGTDKFLRAVANDFGDGGTGVENSGILIDQRKDIGTIFDESTIFFVIVAPLALSSRFFFDDRGDDGEVDVSTTRKNCRAMRLACMSGDGKGP